jgi:hypothetical protein
MTHCEVRDRHVAYLISTMVYTVYAIFQGESLPVHSRNCTKCQLPLPNFETVVGYAVVCTTDLQNKL